MYTLTLILTLSTNSNNSGWHHVEVHPDSWWIRKFEMYGFKYEKELSQQCRKWAEDGRANVTVMAPDGKPFRSEHLTRSLKVFSNPAVASLPQHAHLFPRHGCWKRYATQEEKKADPDHFYSITKPCEGSKETGLPPDYVPLPILPEMHQRWNDTIAAGIQASLKKESGGQMKTKKGQR
jgi:hypothetical protein